MDDHGALILKGQPEDCTSTLQHVNNIYMLGQLDIRIPSIHMYWLDKLTIAILNEASFLNTSPPARSLISSTSLINIQ
jgi:hypothetical protein